MRASRAVVKYRVPILILALALLIPSFFGMVNTRINYDMLDYLPDDMDTVTGQNLLMEDFGKGAFSLIVVEDMPSADIRRTAEKLRTIEHVETVVCYEDLADPTIPKALLPESIYKEFNSGDSTLMAVFFDTSTSADATMDAIREVRSAVGKQCFVTGMSALVTDLKDLCEEEEPVYVALAVVCACAAMMLLLDSWLVPFVFLASIGMSILMNLGSNWFLGEISYITKALAAVLQLAVTMDYSIFLWHSYNEKRASTDDKYEAMAQAIHDTFVSVLHDFHDGPRLGHRNGQGRAAGRHRLRDDSAVFDSSARQAASEDAPPRADSHGSGLCQVGCEGVPGVPRDFRAAGCAGLYWLFEDQRRGVLRHGRMPAAGHRLRDCEQQAAG